MIIMLKLGFSFFLLIFAIAQAEDVFEIKTLSEIPSDQPHNTLYLIDLDDTVFDSISLVGSKAWRKYMVQAAGQDWHDLFSYALAQKYPMKTVEDITPSFVKDLQNKGYVVCGLTARERKFWYYMPKEGVDLLTVKQLHSVDVDFNNGSLERGYPDLSQDPEYFQGVFFANTELKGDYLLKLFQAASRFPEKMIFIDDKLSQVESVAEALAQLGIPHECYLYSATDRKAAGFDPLIANIQLFYFYESDGQIIVSDQEAARIAESNPEKSAGDYLQAVLDILSFLV
jgi:hypothetical protein